MADTDTDAEIFDAFLALVQSSAHFDDQDEATVLEAQSQHKRHVKHRIEMDATLAKTKEFLEKRMRDLDQFVASVPECTRDSAVYKSVIDIFAEKQIKLKKKYKMLREKREAVHGKYYSPEYPSHKMARRNQNSESNGSEKGSVKEVEVTMGACSSSVSSSSSS